MPASELEAPAVWAKAHAVWEVLERVPVELVLDPATAPALALKVREMVVAEPVAPERVHLAQAPEMEAGSGWEASPAVSELAVPDCFGRKAIRTTSEQ